MDIILVIDLMSHPGFMRNLNCRTHFVFKHSISMVLRNLRPASVESLILLTATCT